MSQSNKRDNIINRVFKEEGFGFGKNNPNALSTKSTSVYRITGFGQLTDIINTGTVRPKEGKIKGGHVGEVFWSIGGENLYYYDKRPVLEVLAKDIRDGQLGALSIDDLQAVWIYNNKENKYDNKINTIKEIYKLFNENNIKLTKEEIQEIIKKHNHNENEIENR